MLRLGPLVQNGASIFLHLGAVPVVPDGHFGESTFLQLGGVPLLNLALWGGMGSPSTVLLAADLALWGGMGRPSTVLLAADLALFSDHAAYPLNLLTGQGVQGFASGSDAMQVHAEERALLKAVAAGDAKALERLFARTQTRVFRFLMRVVKSQAIAEELLNEVFLSVWQNAHRYEGRSEPLTWMLSIAHNKAISAMRKRTEVLGIADEAARDLVSEEDAPDVTAQKHDKSAKIRSCIAELSVNHQAILDLVYYQDQSVTEVAEVLGIPENTVKTRMFYARKKLSELLRARGIDRGWP